MREFRFGIGEWYGRSFIHLTPAERRAFAALSIKGQHRQQPCIPRLAENPNQYCTKSGGVCSLRQYELINHTVRVEDGELITTCPERFREDRKVFKWVGETILGHPKPIIVEQVGFLERLRQQKGEETADVGKIDMILIHPDLDCFFWCALEMQAVYFSGDAMSRDFKAIDMHQDSGLPFPAGRRRPDFRSSGPKRLMPQLQIKVPTLRRWGKKMAVVVDTSFFRAMGEMDHVSDISNCDIVWFIIRYNEKKERAALDLGEVRFTTLERTVEGLTAGTPVSLPEFEGRIRKKLKN
jgi:hypothetical protein